MYNGSNTAAERLLIGRVRLVGGNWGDSKSCEGHRRFYDATDALNQFVPSFSRMGNSPSPANVTRNFVYSSSDTRLSVFNEVNRSEGQAYGGVG
jgi:hypothetical protein